MKNLTLLTVLAAISASSAALAGPCDPMKMTLSGDQAKTLVSAIKSTGAVPETTKSAITYTIAKLACVAVNGGVYDDGLNQYACMSGPKKARSNPANAELLFNALDKAGVFGDSGMSKTVVEATGVNCQIKTGDEISYSCTMTAISAEACQP
jgi:hypothetical protein